MSSVIFLLQQKGNSAEVQPKFSTWELSLSSDSKLKYLCVFKKLKTQFEEKAPLNCLDTILEPWHGINCKENARLQMYFRKVDNLQAFKKKKKGFIRAKGPTFRRESLGRAAGSWRICVNRTASKHIFFGIRVLRTWWSSKAVASTLSCYEKQHVYLVDLFPALLFCPLQLRRCSIAC